MTKTELALIVQMKSDVETIEAAFDRLQAKLARVEAEISHAQRARDRFCEMGRPESVGLLDGVISRMRVALSDT